MEDFGGVYRDKKVLLTGHTGFKGSWLALWLRELGAEVTGIGLDPCTTPSHWDLLGLDVQDKRLDIRDAAAVSQVFAEAAPEVVFHLAAQPLVRRSYREPLETWSTNVMGTTNVLEACRQQPSVRSIVVITTDKCYENQEWSWGYRENDRLGGHDPYSASKACAELVVKSYRDAFFEAQEGGPLLASARAGNVIGGGDWSEDRLIPDLVRSIKSKEQLIIRSPHATRPWQHVLESLSGYLQLCQQLIEGKREFAQAWNFGPGPEGNCTVGEMLEQLRESWPALTWEVTKAQQPHEAKLLHLDSSKAKYSLRWQPVWSLQEGLAATASWYQGMLEKEEVLSQEQLQAYRAAAQAAGLSWCGKVAA